MISFLISYFSKIEIWKFFVIMFCISWLLYAIIMLALKMNRTSSNLKVALLTGAITSFVFDIIWLFTFFDNFTYFDPGFKGKIWLFVFPGVMMILGLIQSYINTSRFLSDEKKRIAEEKESKKKEKKNPKQAQSAPIITVDAVEVKEEQSLPEAPCECTPTLDNNNQAENKSENIDINSSSM